MQKITFHNNTNDLEYSFATDTPRALLSAFDGNSLGAEFVQFKPIAFDGSRTLSHTLNARTITLTANWYAVNNGKHSRSAALAEWEKIQYVFSPGDVGTLTWTNGTVTRTIECYTNETPVLNETVRGLFSADIKLTADYPLWQGNVLHSAVFTGTFKMSAVEIENTCPIAVPFVVKIEGAIVWLFGSKQRATLSLDPERCGVSDLPVYIDTSRQLAYRHPRDADGNVLSDTEVNLNYCLSPTSSFFKLMPGMNVIALTMNTDDESETTVTFNWRDCYLGVNK